MLRPYIILLGLSVILMSNAWSFERLFYLRRSSSTMELQQQLENIKRHARQIDIIGPQNYRLDEDGTLSGMVEPQLLALAGQEKIKVMPLVVNINVDQDKFHRFLHNPEAQKKARLAMLDACQKNHFYGWQFDFENILVSDRKQFTQFFVDTAHLLKQHGFKISIASVPTLTDKGDSNLPYDRWKFTHWSGAYDNAALAKAADFISIMAYDQHTTLTTPGPIASIAWVDPLLRNLLHEVPRNKLSLGIPSYSGYWTVGTAGPKTIPEQFQYRSRETQIGYKAVLKLLRKFEPEVIWSSEWQSYYTVFTHHEKNEYLFIEDAHSFRSKLTLARHYHLRGISVWRLGLEDPRSWRYLVKKRI